MGMRLLQIRNKPVNVLTSCRILLCKIMEYTLSSSPAFQISCTNHAKWCRWGNWVTVNAFITYSNLVNNSMHGWRSRAINRGRGGSVNKTQMTQILHLCVPFTANVICSILTLRLAIGLTPRRGSGARGRGNEGLRWSVAVHLAC